MASEGTGNVLPKFAARASTLRKPSGNSDRPIGFVGDDAAWLAALCDRCPTAVAAFHDRYAALVHRVLVRILGRDPDFEDVYHETFLRALGAIRNVRDPSRLNQWMTSVAVLTARTCLQGRWRRRWLQLMAPDELAGLDVVRPALAPEVEEAVGSTYQLLERMPATERILFSLRFIDGMELTELAAACGISVATVKRRLGRAERRFSALARRHPVLCEWVERGSR